MDLKSFVRDVPNFPKPGIIFKDITPLLDESAVFNYIINQIAEHFKGSGITKIAGIDSRGFIFGSALAHHIGIGFVPIRKKGKLPAATFSARYELEYGFDELEIHQDALTINDCVLLVDDLLATGGTAAAACELIEKCGSKLGGISFVIELTFLNGREKLPDTNILSLIKYA